MQLTHRPAKSPVGAGFGPRPRPTPTSPAIHYGQDYGWGSGRGVFAAARGRVKATAPAGAYGLRIILDHGNGWETWYCHLFAKYVNVGMTVASGATIGWMGETGNAAGVHLHFELRHNGVAVNPEPYFVSTSPAGGETTPLPAPAPPEESDMIIISSSAPGVVGKWLVGPQYVHWLTGEEYDQLARLYPERDFGTNRQAFNVVVNAHVNPHPSYGPWAALLDDEARLLAAIRAIPEPESGATVGHLTDEDKIEIINAINRVDENTLIALGLQRIP